MSWRLILPVQACLEVWSWVLISWHASLSPQAISSTPMGSVLFHLQVTHTFVPLAQTLMSNCSLSCFIWTRQSHIHDFPPPEAGHSGVPFSETGPSLSSGKQARSSTCSLHHQGSSVLPSKHLCRPSTSLHRYPSPHRHLSPGTLHWPLNLSFHIYSIAQFSLIALCVSPLQHTS